MDVSAVIQWAFTFMAISLFGAMTLAAVAKQLREIRDENSAEVSEEKVSDAFTKFLTKG